MNLSARLYVVDDETLQREALSTLLEGEGYAVTGFSNARDALNALREQPCDLLLTDLRLPCLSGTELIREALKISPDLSAILMTGHGSMETAVEAMQMGVLDYILKPFKFTEISPVIRRALENRRLRLQNAVLLDKVTAANQRLTELNTDLDSFAARVAHDLNSVMHLIQGHATGLSSRSSNSFTPQEWLHIQRIKESSDRGSKLVSDLLAFARLGDSELNLNPVNLADVVSRARILSELDSDGPRPNWRVQPLPVIQGDEALLEQVFLNLFSNALKFSSKQTHPEIHVDVHETDDKVTITVRDNGVGFDPELAANLFKPFQRLHNQHDYQGHGMGLANVKKIIERHHGVIEAHSNAGQGAAFAICLPRHANSTETNLTDTNTATARAPDELLEQQHALEALKFNMALQRLGGQIGKLGGWAIDIINNDAVYWSEETFQLLDQEADQIPTLEQGMSLYVGRYKKVIAEAIENAKQQGLPFDIVVQMNTFKNRRIWARIAGEVMKDADDKPVRIHGCIQDITEQRKKDVMMERINGALLAQNHINQRISTFDSAQAMYEEICEAAPRLAKIPLVWVVDFKRETLEFKIAATGGRDTDFVATIMSKLAIRPDSPLLQKLRTGQVYVVDDLRNEPMAKHWLEESLARGFESMAIIPLHLNGRLHSGLVYMGDESYFFSDEMVHLLDTVARNRSMALDNLINGIEKAKTMESLRLLQTCLERLNDMVLVTDAEPFESGGMKIQYVNKAFLERTGYTREEIYGQTPAVLEGVDTQPDAKTRIREALSRQEAVREELITYTKNGEKMWVDVEIVPMIDPLGKCTHWIGIQRDITEQKIRQDILEQNMNGLVQSKRESQAQLARMQLLNQITRAISHRQSLASIYNVVVNHVEERLPSDFSLMATYNNAKNILTVRSVGQRSQALADKLGLFVGAQVKGHGVHLEVALKGKRVHNANMGATRGPIGAAMNSLGGLYSLIINPLMKGDEVLGILVISRTEIDAFSSEEIEFVDQLSEHVAVALSQVELLNELQEAYRELQSTQNMVLQQERLHALAGMAIGIAHDINNAISPATLYLESLLENEKNLSEKGYKQLRIVQTAIDDVSNTVDRMGRFARSRSELEPANMCDANDMCLEAIELTRPRWGDMALRNGITIGITHELSNPLPKLAVSETELREILTNLILNAVDALPQGGHIQLKTEFKEKDTEPLVVICLQDNGIGMSKEQQARCFEPFFTTKGERGTGLGLSMVYGIVQRADGFMEIHSEPGKGTTVSLYFPVRTASEPAAFHTSSVEFDPNTGRPLNLLLVDDDPNVLAAMSAILEMSGHQIHTAGSGALAAQLFNETARKGKAFDAVITDLGMPEMDGKELAEMIKSLSPATPVLMLTGWGKQMSLSQEEVPQVDMIMAKPPKPAELEMALRKLCRR
ncbi:ATP-binding protein [Limnobacter sp.]|uniref:ATP-binding protein n=1 Tax=Limnobacter sp. TaxID=2003368 RepID=UPI0025C66DD8|nr:ATP-binding protein [Limnobacter sp.]